MGRAGGAPKRLGQSLALPTFAEASAGRPAISLKLRRAEIDASMKKDIGWKPMTQCGRSRLCFQDTDGHRLEADDTVRAVADWRFG